MMSPIATEDLGPISGIEVPTGLSIPLIDISPLTSPDFVTRKTCADKILSAFQTHGFLYLTSLPDIHTSTVTNVFSNSAAFFGRPQSQKDTLAWTTPLANRGYVSQGREKTSHSLSVEDVAKERASGADLKESMEIGRDGVEGSPNQWPDKIDAEGLHFREVMTEFFGKCKDLHRLVMSAIALGFDLDEHYFDPFVTKGDNNLRLLHYPSVRKDIFTRNAGQVRAGAHTDYGSITLLWQDNRGGLQVQPDGEGGEWQDVTPVPGTVVVNAGDLLSRWSNNRIRSTRHRVVEPPAKTPAAKVTINGEEIDIHPARYSIAYFCNPDYDTVIQALPNTYSREEDVIYAPVLTERYLVDRLTATY